MTPARYTWSGGTEQMLRFGPDNGPVVIAALPLFEEANRTRAFVVTVLRALAERDVASILPDLPGTGESLVATYDATVAAMREAYRAVVEQALRPAFAFAIRSAALFHDDAPLAGRYYLAPQSGAQVLRELKRIRHADGKAPAGDDWMTAETPIEIAGNLLSPHLLTELAGAIIVGEMPLRTARMATDAQPADIKFDAAPLWRRAEPGNDPALAALVADDIAQWIATCGG